MSTGIPWDRDDDRRGYVKPGGRFEALSDGQARAMLGRRRGDDGRYASPADATPAGLKRLRRKLVIAAAARAGIPANWIAEAMGLARSRVQDILAELEQAS